MMKELTAAINQAIDILSTLYVDPKYKHFGFHPLRRLDNERTFYHICIASEHSPEQISEVVQGIYENRRAQKVSIETVLEQVQKATMSGVPLSNLTTFYRLSPLILSQKKSN